MARPKTKRRICEIPQLNEKNGTIKLNIDEYEAIRLKDYHNIKQKESAELMGISQSTFHRILNSAREKLAISLIDRKKIIITGVDYVSKQNTYKCQDCGFKWSNPEKEYNQCPDCKSKNIIAIKDLLTRKSFGGAGRGKCHELGKCICPKCGYGKEKIRGKPCRNIKCPKCGTPLMSENKQCYNY